MAVAKLSAMIEHVRPTGDYAKVILDSISPFGDRLTTMELRMRRFVLPEFNTHRSHSKNSASSRARPVQKVLNEVWDDPVFPYVWASEKKGMQGGPELTGKDLDEAQALWVDVWKYTYDKVQRYVDDHPLTEEGSVRLHKSLLNRLLEPFMWHTVIASATDAGWNNFFRLRSSNFTDLAMPEIMVVADFAYDAYAASTPKQLACGEWHTPYIRDDENFDLKTRREVSVARCARVSYLTHDGKRDANEDVSMYERLVGAVPRHESPLEHVATPAHASDGVPLGNFTGWHQLRHWRSL